MGTSAVFGFDTGGWTTSPGPTSAGASVGGAAGGAGAGLAVLPGEGLGVVFVLLFEGHRRIREQAASIGVASALVVPAAGVAVDLPVTLLVRIPTTLPSASSSGPPM